MFPSVHPRVLCGAHCGLYPSFREFSENLEVRTLGLKEQSLRERELSVCSLHLAPLKPDRDSTANRTPTRADERQDFSVLGACLRVQQIPSFENRFRPDG